MVYVHPVMSDGGGSNFCWGFVPFSEHNIQTVVVLNFVLDLSRTLTSFIYFSFTPLFHLSLIFCIVFVSHVGNLGTPTICLKS